MREMWKKINEWESVYLRGVPVVFVVARNRLSRACSPSHCIQKPRKSENKEKEKGKRTCEIEREGVSHAPRRTAQSCRAFSRSGHVFKPGDVAGMRKQRK